ncbi:hypothetical protein A5787_05565 [Mycobacterium sp. 852002-50816_SCH5313054-b]|uniref:DUF3349 domain-containing protein n=1 Tax=Mycobacterium sp. 852002-50816_SCH5313054-b TaxID=1834092 RepID=UPI0008015215|nr:DUF3349 domain-containing protein [Mycobacterium sp. 852002-50816_SCH5313054-b]OBF53587.1 hypothetical protein A5787_05565 [Mycobacterium sp. 852002-50816_SCH5313054-b]
MTSTHASHKHAKFLKSVIRWLDVGYPQGVPGPDQVALFALLKSTPLTQDQLEEVVHNIISKHKAEGDGTVDRDEIEKFISETTHREPGRDDIIRVAATLAAAGWPLAGIDVSEVCPGDDHAEAAEEVASQGVSKTPS